MGRVPHAPEDMSAEWLGEALGTKVDDFSIEQIGVGVGILGRLYRVTSNGKSAIAKFPTLDEGARMNVVEPLNFYEKEVRFYQEAAKRTPIATPRVYAAHFDRESGDFVLLLEDLGDRRMADQIAGCGSEDVDVAIDALIALHTSWWDADFPAWLPAYTDPPYPQVIAGMYKQAWPRALEVLGDHLSPEMRELGERYGELVDFFMETLGRTPRTLCHGDFRLDNLFFAANDADPAVTVIDWQICLQGRGGYDLAYFVSQSLTTDVRRACEAGLKEKYLSGLASAGVEYPREDFERDYAITVAFCFIYPVNSAGQIDFANDRQRELVVGMLDRAVQAIEDNKCLDLLP